MVELAPEPVLRVAIAGNPNAGKSSIFNCLTGLRQKVGNYPGVTVERKVGRAQFDDLPVEIIDLPGAYSLTVQSPDEEVARDVLFGWVAEEPPPDVVVIVVDATNLQRNLFMATQILELGYRTVVALNMTDRAAAEGVEVDAAALAKELGVPVVPTVASRAEGLDQLRATILEAVPSAVRGPLPQPLQLQVDRLRARLLARQLVPEVRAAALALRLITTPTGLETARRRCGAEVADAVEDARGALARAGIPWQGCEAASRYPWLGQIVARATRRAETGAQRSPTERLDRVLTHPFWGPVLFFLAMGVVFQGIYSWATPVMEWVDAGTHWLGQAVRGLLPAGILTDLLVDGVITGVGAVLIFLPQILLLFAFLSLLEDSGYMSRAAFVMDRIMSKVGLHGRSFVPLLSSFACAIPGIMATRTIASRRDRLTTILVAPLITCPARLPVYALLIGAFVPQQPLLGGLVSTRGMVLLGLYLLGIVGALAVAAVLKRTILRGPTPVLLLELPPYRRPSLRHVAADLRERAVLFLRFAGRVILALSIVLWSLAAFPRADVSGAAEEARRNLALAGLDASAAAALDAETAAVASRLQLEQSYMGRLGRVIEPVVRPLGFDWRIGVGLVGSFAAREVMVATMGIIFAVGGDADEGDERLIERLRAAQRDDGSKLFTPPVVASLLIFFVFACQCISTIAVVVRETGGWKWPLVMIGYMSVLAYTASFLTYHGLLLAGW